MAINFETVTGNQSSANVLAQINNNFAKINSNPVPKADFAANADTVDNKHASELIPGAATFLDSITSLANLSIGRYFCTQTRQSWEPVTTTGSRTFLIEVSLNTPNNLKNYKINYIAGAGAGESYYSDYSSGNIRWNRVINNTNIGSMSAVKNTYDSQDRSGRVVTYDEMMVFQEGETILPDGFISVNDGTGRYYKISGTCTWSRSASSGRCNTTNYWNVNFSVGIYNSNFQLIKTINAPQQEIELWGASQTNYVGQMKICGQFINKTTGDMIIGVGARAYYSSNTYSNPVQGYYYLSTATNTIIFISMTNKTVVNYDSCNGGSVVRPSYWYNNHFGIFERGATSSSSSYYTNIQMYYIELNENRNSIVANNSMVIAGSAYGFTTIGQKGQYYYICTNTSNYTSNPSLVRINITARSAQSVAINIASTTSSAATCSGAMMDNDFIYINIRYQTSSNYYYKVVKYNDDLVLVATSSQFQNEYSCYMLLTNDYVLIYNSNSSSSSVQPSKCFNKSNLNLISSYQKYFYFYNSVHNPYSTFGVPVSWLNQDLKNDYVYGLFLTENYVLEGQAISFYIGGPYSSTSSSSSNYQYVYLFPIINVATGNTVGYFANTLIYNKRDDGYPIYIDGIGLCFRGKKLITSNINYLLKSYKLN